MKRKLVDRAEFSVSAGRGGSGSIHFRREKYVPKGGPDGGNGGMGGNVVLRTNEHLATLRYFSGKDRFEAETGRPGGKRQASGDDAEDLVIEVPVGTVVFVKAEDCRLLRGRKLYGEDVERIVSSGFKIDRVPYFDFDERWGVDEADVEGEWVEVADLDKAGDEVVLARGGRGGLGNVTYKSSRNTTPKVAQRGELGEKYIVRLELKVLADVGLVGLPNAGKSTLLSVLTAAKPEIADYPFTTLSPNLGVMEQKGVKLVIADIPGLIEDAHKGKGLGADFLRHVERCKMLVYLVAPMEEDLLFEANELPKRLWKQYETVLVEVTEYGHDLSQKESIVVVNKIDLMQDAKQKIAGYFKKKGIDVSLVSAATTEGIDKVKGRMQEMFKVQ